MLPDNQFWRDVRERCGDEIAFNRWCGALGHAHAKDDPANRQTLEREFRQQLGIPETLKGVHK